MSIERSDIVIEMFEKVRNRKKCIQYGGYLKVRSCMKTHLKYQIFNKFNLSRLNLQQFTFGTFVSYHVTNLCVHNHHVNRIVVIKMNVQKHIQWHDQYIAMRWRSCCWNKCLKEIKVFCFAIRFYIDSVILSICYLLK